MNALTFFINGREYRIACDPGQEAQLQRLADEVDVRVRGLAFRMGHSAGHELLLITAAITMADELADLRREVSNLRAEAKQGAATLDGQKIAEMELAVSQTIEDIAARIEKIAERAEMV